MALLPKSRSAFSELGVSIFSMRSPRMVTTPCSIGGIFTGKTQRAVIDQVGAEEMVIICSTSHSWRAGSVSDQSNPGCPNSGRSRSRLAQVQEPGLTRNCLHHTVFTHL